MAENESGAAGQPKDDLRSMLAAAADAFEEPAAETPKQPEGEAGELQEAPASGGRARGADGKFRAAADDGVATDSDETAEKPATANAGERKPAAETEGTQPADGEQAAAAAAAATGTEAPQHWSGADKATFGQLPAEAKGPFLDFYKRMEAGFTPKLQRLASYERDYQGVPEIFAPHADALRQKGQTPAHIIRTWATVEQSLLTHKAAVERGQSPGDDGAALVARIIAGYRIDPGAIARVLTGLMQSQGGGGAAAGDNQAAPARTALPPEVEARIMRVEQAEQQRVERAAVEKVGSAQQQIDAFANEKDAAGALKHPFFADLEQEMTAQARLDAAAGKTPVLSDLYDRAVWANQATRTKLLGQQREAEAKQAAVERKAKTEAAHRAAASVTGSPGPGQTQAARPANRSLRDDLRDAAADHDAA